MRSLFAISRAGLDGRVETEVGKVLFLFSKVGEKGGRRGGFCTGIMKSSQREMRNYERVCGHSLCDGCFRGGQLYVKYAGRVLKLTSCFRGSLTDEIN